jgi:predicted transcriptional regulator of viral defense system
MSCADIPEWYLRHRIPVINTRSGTWRDVSDQLLPPGYETTTCLRRLADAKRVRQLARGLWQVLDPAREPPAIALAEAVFRDVEHYITTDAALAAEGLIDQPVPVITIVARKKARPLTVGPATIRAVWMDERDLAAAEVVRTTRDGYQVTLASPAQAIVDALAEPRWMTHGSLLPEVLQQLPATDIAAAAERSLARSKAAAARLGYWLDDTGLPIPEPLGSFVPNARTELVPGRRGPYSTRWRVYG